MASRLFRLCRTSALSRALCTALLSFFLSTNSAAATETPEEFIERLAQDAITFLTDKSIPAEVRNENFRTMLRSAFDVDRGTRFLLGPFQRRATEEELAAFRQALEDNLVETYAWRFTQYKGQEYRIVGARDGPRGAKVVQSTVALNEGEAPVVIEWVVNDTDDGWRIFDIQVEGLSLLVTQRDEYVSVIRRNGGRVSALIDALKRQTAVLKRKSSREAEKIN